jgi:hypothetical protein
MLGLLAAIALQTAAPAADPVATPPPYPGAAEAVTEASRNFFAAQESGRFDEAWAMLDAEQQARRPRERWVAAAREYYAIAGSIRSRRLTGVTFVDRPAGRPVTIAGIAYSADSPNLVFSCGTLVWVLQPDRGWRLAREDHRGAQRADAPDATPEQIAEGRRQADCPD